MRRRVLWASILAGSVLALALTYRIATNRYVFGSVEGGWAYRYLAPFNARLVEPFIIAVVLVSAGIGATWKPRTPRRDLAIVLAWCVFAVVVQALLRAATPFPLGAMFASDASNSFYSVAMKYGTMDILGSFERLRPSWELHAQSNLPGKVLLVRALTYISTRPDELAWLVMLLSNLGGVLLYFFVRDLFADRDVAVLAVVLYLFVPAKLFFFPLLNTVTPVAVFLCCCLLMRWLETSNAAYAAALGAAVYGLTLFEPAALIVGIFLLALLIRAVGTKRIAAFTAAGHILVGAAAFLAVHAAMILAFHFNLFSAFVAISRDAAAFNVQAQRPYGIWLRQNVIDFLLGVGICQVVLFAVAFREIALVCTGLGAMVATADLIGVNRGEVQRLWIFLACLWQIPAAYLCARFGTRAAFTLVVATTLLLDLVASGMVGFIAP
jgi:hypothetical protein